MTAYYEKPKGWSEAPKSSWVSGTPIGQSEIRMPKLGDPGAHENASEKMSFGDDGLSAENTYRVAPDGKQVKPGEPCPAGTETKGAACVKTEGAMGVKSISNFDRDRPKAPEGPDPQIARLAKEGVRGRGK